MPPRLLPGVRYGFVDTLAKYPTFWSFNSGAVSKISNQFAAMPSVHICWATWCALVLVPRVEASLGEGARDRATRSSRSIVIVITANHYFLDAVGGLVDPRHRLGHRRRCFTRAGRRRARSPSPSLIRARADRYDLDHVALAAADTSRRAALPHRRARRHRDLRRAGDRLPPDAGLASATPTATACRVELLEPWDDRAERLPRPLRRAARRRPAPPHVQGARPRRRARARARRGLPPGEHRRLATRSGRKRSCMPREAHGTVVQLAETHGHPDHAPSCSTHVAEHGPNMHPRWWVDPEPAAGPPATLRRVVLRTPDAVVGARLLRRRAAGRRRTRDATTASISCGRAVRGIRLEAAAGRDARASTGSRSIGLAAPIAT